MTGEPHAPKRKRTIAMVLAAGCGCVGILGVLAAVGVWASWGDIQSVYEAQAESLAELQTVQRAIQREYGTDQVDVRAGTHSISSGPSEHFLSVGLVDPPFLAELADADREAKAREIAAFARAAHPSPQRFTRYDVSFTNRTGTVVSVTSRSSFSFSASELSSPTPLD